jgi:hypothetical protein
VTLDWLLGCWLLVIGTVFACVCAVGLLAYYIHHKEVFEVYNWTTGLADLVLYLIGSMYILAGSYPIEGHHPQRVEHAQWMASADGEGEDGGRGGGVLAQRLPTSDPEAGDRDRDRARAGESESEFWHVQDGATV